nr:hypothetical protein [Tanacetum cinerariifolium]
MANDLHKEVLKDSTSKGAEPSTSDAEHDGSDNGSSSSSEDLNFRGFTDEEAKVLSSMILRQVEKAIKNVIDVSSSGNGWKRYEDGGESPENMVESGGGDGGLKGCLDRWFVKPRSPKTPILSGEIRLEKVVSECNTIAFSICNVRIKRLHEVTAVKVRVNAVKLNLVLLINAACTQLMLLVYKLLLLLQVNVASVTPPDLGGSGILNI